MTPRHFSVLAIHIIGTHFKCQKNVVNQPYMIHKIDIEMVVVILYCVTRVM